MLVLFMQFFCAEFCLRRPERFRFGGLKPTLSYTTLKSILNSKSDYFRASIMKILPMAVSHEIYL